MGQVTFRGGNKHGTTTKGKLDTISKQVALVKEFVTKFGLNLRNGKCYGLPGPYMQCPRHIEEYSQYGASEKNQVFIENEPRIHKAHLAWKERFGFKGKCIQGDAYEILETRLAKNENISIIDFDKCLALEQRDLDLIRNASTTQDRIGVDVLILTVQVKSHINTLLLKMKRRFGLKRRPNRNNKTSGLSNPISAISRFAVFEAGIINGFEVYALPYKGRSQMCVFVLLNSRKHMLQDACQGRRKIA